ncbi:hypothetical protein D3C71_1983240 [compost metagenome]
MVGVGVGQRHVVVAQKRSCMGAAGLAARCIGQHHDMGDGQGGFHRLGGTGMDLVVQHSPMGVLRGAYRCGH